MVQKKKSDEQDVLVVRDEKTGEISVVAGLSRDGTPKRAPAKAENTSDFLRFDRNSDLMDSFFRNFFRQCKEEYRIRRDTVISRLRQIPGVVVEEPMGAFYVMASLPVDDADRFQHWLLDCFDDKGDTVMFAPGAPFYETPGKGINEVRIAYVLKQEDLARAMEVLAKGIARYQREVMNVVAPTLG